MVVKGSGVVNAIGIYIGAASFYFVVVFGADVVNRYVQGKPWYPTKYISLNAISLTALAIAIKIPTDLTTPMTEPYEQLSKLTGTILVCTAMANTMPSLGGMDGASTIVSNVGALVVTIVTLIVDLWIQITTKVIYRFWMEQIVVMVIMFLQLLFVLSIAVAIPTTKEFMERQFQVKHNLQSESMLMEDKEEGNYVYKIKKNIIKYWFMAHTSNPQYIVARSPTCIASGSLCFVTVGVMIEAILNIIYGYGYTMQVSGYDSSIVITILSVQIFAIILGTIGPASRCMWWSEVVFKNFKSIINDGCFKVEDYWVSSLVKWKDAPLRMYFKGVLIRKSIRLFKWCILTLLVKQQMVIVTVCKLIRAVSVVPMLLLHKILQLILHLYFFLPATIGIVIFFTLKKITPQLILLSPYFVIFLMRTYLVLLKRKLEQGRLNIMDVCQHSIRSHYVLHLEGETGLVGFIVQESHNNGRNHGNNKKKNKEKNAKLIQLIKNHSTFTEGFHYVNGFRTFPESTAHSDLLRCSWALPLVTLSCIAVTLPGVDRNDVKLLLKGVNRGLKFVKIIEKCFDDKLLINMREAAEFVWLGIDLDNKWLDFDLRTFQHSKEKDAREAVEKLKEIARERISKFKNRAEEDAWNRPYEWPPMVLAADCMYTVCSTILQNHEQYRTSMKLFEWLRKTISDILGACLTNLPEVIHLECSKKSIEVREEGVSNAANLFAETENLLVLLYDPVVASRFPERKKNIEEWQRRDVIVATKDLSLHSEPSSGTTPQLDYTVIEVDSTNV